MGYTIYGTQKTRITLYATDGTTPLVRYTMQRETREGMTLTFTPEGVPHQLGSGANWAKTITHRGFRPALELAWDYGTTSLREVRNGASWDAATSVNTAEAIAAILNSAFVTPCLVEPRLDKSFGFLAQPDPGTEFILKDTKGIAHGELALKLVAQSLCAIPNWAVL